MPVPYALATDSTADLEAVVAVSRAARPDDTSSVADLRDWNVTQRAAHRAYARWLARDGDAVVGFAYVGQSPWLEPSMMIARTMVHPDHEGRGHGMGLLERAERTALDHGAARILGWATDPTDRTVRFLERGGYREIDRDWASTLEIDRCDLDAMRRTVDRMAAIGVRVVSVADLAKERPEWRRDLHRLYAEVDADVPTRFPTAQIGFADFEALSLGRRMLPDGFLVAIAGDELVGLTEPQSVDGSDRVIEQDLTGVRSSHRGRGIAKAIKAASVLWAAESGYTTIRTQNAQSNSAMLAVNDWLGFERDHVTIEVLKTL
jgi:mycothiol synthase